MNRDHAFRRPARAATAIAGAAFVLILSGCGGSTEAAETAQPSTTVSSPSVATSEASGSETSGASPSGAGEAGAAASTYTDGTYTASGSYQTPESVETVSVTISLEGDVITAVEVTGDPQARESQQYQQQFIGGIADEVVGKSLDEVSVSRVAGSSLTSTGFNEALETIKSEAAA